MLVNLGLVVKAVTEETPLLVGTRRLTSAELQALFRVFLVSSGPQDHYDCFITYRWSDSDKDFAMKLFDNFRHMTRKTRAVRGQRPLLQYTKHLFANITMRCLPCHSPSVP